MESEDQRYAPPESDVTRETTLFEDDLALFLAPEQSEGVRRSDPNVAKYLKKWERLREDEGAWAGFHWPAFFVGFLWCLYRGMYREAAFIFLSPLAVGIVLGLGSEFMGIPEQIADGAIDIYGRGLQGVCGFMANGWYFRRARRAIEESNGDKAKIAAAGGVHPLSVWVGIAIMIATYGGLAGLAIYAGASA